MGTIFIQHCAELAPSFALDPIQTKITLIMSDDFSNVTRVDQFLDVGIRQ